MISKKELEIFEKIHLYDRYSYISNQYRYEDKSKDYSNDKTIEIVKELGYSAKYRKKEKFFQIIEIIDGIKFYFHFSLEYGMVEVIIFWEYENNKDLSGGGLLSVVCKLIEISKNEFKIYAKNGVYFPEELQLEGKKRMNLKDFLNGFHSFDGLKLIK